jgi:CheY-like chemotaxis protein
LLEIIDDILDLAKIQAGKFSVEINDCSLTELVDGVTVLMKPVAEEKNLEFNVRPCDPLPAGIRTDSVRVRQCLINLIGNAIKFTEAGHVNLCITLFDDSDKPHIRFDVEDTGIGISEDKQQEIFNPFIQADGSTTRKFGGTGLGLAITRQLAEILGGRLDVTSEEGKGSAFSLIIPTGVDVNSQPLLDGQEMSSESISQEQQTQSPKFTGKVLVAEDVLTNQVLVRLLLERLGLEVTTVEDGALAVEEVMNREYDLILMDIQMPNMNGYEATQAIRKKGVRTPVVALTANAMKGDKDKCIDAGCDGYLAKPIDRRALLQTIGKYLRAEEPELIHVSNSPM